MSRLADPFVHLRFARLLQSKEALRAIPVLALIGVMQLVPLFQWVDSLAVAGFIGLIAAIPAFHRRVRPLWALGHL